MANKYSRFFSLLNNIKNQGTELDRHEVVREFTHGIKKSITDLTVIEYDDLCNKLQSMLPKKPVEKNDKKDKTRKAIISQFLSVGKTVFDAISWSEKYGVKGKKKSFNDYTAQELYLLLQNAKKVKAFTIQSIEKNSRNNGLQQGK
jgi:hypothetical protein